MKVKDPGTSSKIPCRVVVFGSGVSARCSRLHSAEIGLPQQALTEMFKGGRLSRFVEDGTSHTGPSARLRQRSDDALIFSTFPRSATTTSVQGVHSTFDLEASLAINETLSVFLGWM